jgi:hypothetical protein
MMLRFPFASVLSASERLYRLLLFVYPPAYRREYGALMRQAFRDLCRNSYRQRGMLGLVLLWFRLLADLVPSSIGQHLDLLREGGYLMSKKEHARAIVAATLPLTLGLFLGLVNPRFVSRMFVTSSAQPWGWIMIASVFILVGMAYFFQRKAFEIEGRPDSSHRAIARPTRQALVRVGSIALFVLPAILLVVLGPAIMTFLDAGF